MHYFRNIPALTVGLLIFSSCLSSRLTDERRTEISFYPVIGMGVRSESASEMPSDTDFGVWATDESGNFIMSGARAAFNGSSWTCTDNEYFWENGVSLRFTAFSPFDTGIRLEDGALLLDNYDSTSDSQFWITETTQPLDRTSNPVVLMFVPATARLEFRVVNGLGADTKIRVEKIIINDIRTKGNFNSSASPQWTLSGPAEDIVAYNAEDNGDDAAQESGLIDKVINVIPQQPTSCITVVYSMKTGDSEWLAGEENSTEELKAEWQAGRRYTYTLTITGSAVKLTTGIGNIPSAGNAIQ